MSTRRNRFLFSFALVLVTAFPSVAQFNNPLMGKPILPNTRDPLEQEALKQAAAFLERVYYPCGDSYFTLRGATVRTPYGIRQPIDPLYVEFKDFHWLLRGEAVLYPPPTEAERLNGVTHPQGDWKGVILIVPSVYRRYEHEYGNVMQPKRWTKWIDNLRESVTTGKKERWWVEYYDFSKNNGKWHVGVEGSDYGFDPVDCNAIPQASLKVSQVPDPKPPQIKNPSSPVPATVVADPQLVPPTAIPKKPMKD